MDLCGVCVSVLAWSREERRAQTVKGLASVLKVLEEIHTCSNGVT